jgi:hypothetical protein
MAFMHRLALALALSLACATLGGGEASAVAVTDGPPLRGLLEDEKDIPLGLEVTRTVLEPRSDLLKQEKKEGDIPKALEARNTVLSTKKDLVKQSEKPDDAPEVPTEVEVGRIVLSPKSDLLKFKPSGSRRMLLAGNDDLPKVKKCQALACRLKRTVLTSKDTLIG